MRDILPWGSSKSENIGVIGVPVATNGTAVSPTGTGSRKFHIFSADEGLTSGGMQLYHDRLQILETHERFGEVL